MNISKKILDALDGAAGSTHELTPDEQMQLTELQSKLEALKQSSAITSDTGYFDTLIPRFREKLESSVGQKISAFSLSPFESVRLAAGALLPVMLVFYLIQSQSVQLTNTPADSLTEVSNYNSTQTIEEMVYESPSEITETVNNSFREIISAGSDDVHVIMRESPATENELGQLLEESDLDEIIAQLENKKIL